MEISINHIFKFMERPPFWGTSEVTQFTVAWFILDSSKITHFLIHNDVSGLVGDCGSTFCDNTASTCENLPYLSIRFTPAPLTPHNNLRCNSVRNVSSTLLSGLKSWSAFSPVTRYNPHCWVITRAVSRWANKISSPKSELLSSQDKLDLISPRSRSRRSTSGSICGRDTFWSGRLPPPSSMAFSSRTSFPSKRWALSV